MSYWLDSKVENVPKVSLRDNVSTLMQFKKPGFYIPDPAEKIDTLLLKDAGYFHTTYSQYTDPLEATDAFNKKYPGYLHDHSLDYVLKAFKIVMK
jgi:hypothetical protein